MFTRGSAIRRAGRAGLARNVCVAMGNWLAAVDELPAAAVVVLREALEDPEPQVREHAVWAFRAGRRVASARSVQADVSSAELVASELQHARSLELGTVRATDLDGRPCQLLGGRGGSLCSLWTLLTSQPPRQEV